MNVINLLVTEWQKFSKNAVVSLLAIMFVITFPTGIFIGKELDDVPDPLPDNKIFFEFPTMWDYLGYSGNWLVFFFLGLMIIFLICSEVNYKTMRQNVITGYRRQTFFAAKLASVVVLSLAATIFYAVIGLAIGFYHTEGATLSSALDNDWAFLRFFIMSLGYTSMAFFIAFLVRRTGVAVLLYIAYIMLIEHFLKWLIHFRYIAKNNSINLIEFDLGTIPNNVTINSASLLLQSVESLDNFGIELFSVVNPWELDAGGTGATWNQRTNGVVWDSAGADYDTEAIAYSDPGLFLQR